MSSGKTINIVTLGCAKNEVDTDNLKALLRKRGFEIGTDASAADAVVVHTCSFIEAAKKESLDAIIQAARQKNENAKLIVTGCMVQQHGKDMMAELPEVDAFLGTGQLSQVPDFLEKPRDRFLDRTNAGGLMDPGADIQRAVTGPMAYLRLSEGCSHPCSFCVIPKLRGGVQSRTEETILNEAKLLAEGGVEELVIIGQDTGEWGRDLFKEERRLPSLLRKLRAIKGVRWIRLMYMHPHSFGDDVLEVLAESPDVFTYLDMPLQHIDNTVLSNMKRHMNEADTRRLIEKIRARAPQLSLRTTYIVGFPEETDEQVQNLVNFVKEGHFDYLGAFTYSQEEGTPAGINEVQIPDSDKKARQEAVTDAHFDVADAKGRARIGSTETVVIEGEEGDELLGRSRREAPEIDAIIRLPRLAARGGRFVKARLTAYDSYEFSADPA